MPGAQCTRSLVCDENKHTSVVTTVTPEIARHSPRKGGYGCKKHRQFNAMWSVYPPLCPDLREQ